MQTQLINARMNKESIVNIITDNMKKHFILICIVLLNITAYAQGQSLVLISRLINSNSETFIELASIYNDNQIYMVVITLYFAK